MTHTYFTSSIPHLCNYWERSMKEGSFQFIGCDQSERMSDEQKRAFKFSMLEKGAVGNTDGRVVLPVCTDCPADQLCRAVRLNHQTFEMSVSQKKKMEIFYKNCAMSIAGPVYDPSLFRLYKNYIIARHGSSGTGMVNHTPDDLKRNMEKAKWMIVARDTKNQEPVSFALLDQHDNFFSLEYLAYDMRQMKLSPGLSTIIAAAYSLKFAYPDGYLYLGSWSPGSPKLGYKNQLIGLETRTSRGWHPLPRNAGPQDAPLPPPLTSFII
ncbi:MAG TPA: hypothetical protein VFS88_05405 [Micavibrio sp.]|nr:hypothetical protein [Micavibrio sp.]